MSQRKRPYLGRLDLKAGRVTMEHGAGGKMSAQLVDELFLRHFTDPELAAQNDGARLDVAAGQIALSTDSFVVSPLVFPGGDIGKLAACGTINDVAMMGARPMALTAGFVLEEGFALAELDRIAASLARTASDAGVRVVAGDTKVVERGKGDGVFINTTGIGQMLPGLAPSAASVQPGDVLLVSGPVGDHGVAILSQRPGFDVESDVISDCAVLAGLVADLCAAVPSVRCLRDPTRGGLAAALNEIAWASGLGVRLDGDVVPVRPQVETVCDLLGLDPFDLPCEGRLLAFVPPEAAPVALEVLRGHPLGEGAAIIGTAVADDRRLVTATTGFGGQRLVDWRAGEALPRIC
jgi:hydrogenase expression/formation protein HypE